MAGRLDFWLRAVREMSVLTIGKTAEMVGRRKSAFEWGVHMADALPSRFNIQSARPNAILRTT